MRGRVGVGDEVKDWKEWRYTKGLASRRKHIMRKVVMVVLAPVVLDQENPDAAPRGLHDVCVVPGVRIDGVDAAVDGAVRETLRVEIAVRTPPVTDDRSAGFDPGVYSGRQCVSGSVRKRNKKCSAGPSLNTAKHPLNPDRVSPMVLTPTEFALVSFDGLVRTTDLFRAALHEYQHAIFAEHAPVHDGSVPKQCSFWIWWAGSRRTMS